MPKKTAKKKSPAKAKRLASPLTFKGQQQRLQIFFNKADYEERQMLWNVLSALRGPDKSDEGIDKRATTALIRAVFLGQNSMQSDYLTWSVEDSSTKAARRLQLELTEAYRGVPGSHFVCHAKEAFETLGLHWSTVNEENTF